MVPGKNSNWYRMHRGFGEQYKIRHRFWVTAYLHLRRHQEAFRFDADLVNIYPCWFTDDNRFGVKHYHIGHFADRDSYLAKGQPYLIKIKVTAKEWRRLDELSGHTHPNAYVARVALGLARAGTVCCHADPSACIVRVARNANRE
jgi:hypothetical protein